MDVVRRVSFLATAGLLGIAIVLGSVAARPPVNDGQAAQLVKATVYFDSTIVLARNARPAGARGDELAVGLGYLERLRLGLGSPFLLVDGALHDPRLGPWMASRVSWALLGRLGRGDAYVVNASAFDGSVPGAAHVGLIERAVREASDPRAGELAVRLAYMIAAGKGTVSTTTSGTATEIAALVRDRALAQADLRDLLANATQRHDDVMTVLVARRAARAFRVEQPALAPLTSALRVEAMNAVPALLAALDTLDRVTTAPGSARQGASAPVLGASFAARLRAIGAQQPTIAQVVVTLHGHPRAALSATNDETLAAAYATARFADDTTRRESELALISSAVALRSFAQDSPWFSGDPGPEAADFGAEFGLGTITFARTVPAPWRPYYLRELRGALRDMQSVFPALSVVGLNVSFGTSDLPDSALAMHDPRTRTLALTINTSSGTLAHELSHDLDWQTSRRLFATGGGYSTDRSVREQKAGGALATSVRGLAEARTLRPIPAGASMVPMPDRPAELFARGADWFTASALALGGRSNGFLTAVQDASLPGYAAGTPTAIGAAGTASLVSALDQMTFVPDSAMAGFETMWADAATIDPVVLVRRVLGTPITRVMLAPRGSAAALIPPLRASLCVGTASPELKARDQLLSLTLDARARGAAVRRARYWPPSRRSEWVNGALGLPPYDTRAADAYVAAIRNALVAELRGASADYGVVPAVPASFRSSAASCSIIAR